MQSLEDSTMSGPDAPQLDELKRLLRRLDRALPPPLPASEEASAFRGAGSGSLRPDAASQGSNGTALRTIFLAGGVSMIVSLSVAVLLFQDTPLRRFIATQVFPNGEVRPASTRGGGAPAKDERHTVFVGHTASLPTEVPRSQTEPPVTQSPSDEVKAEKAAVLAAAPPVAIPEGNAVPPEVENHSAEPVAPAEPDRKALVELDAAQFLRRGLLMLSRGQVAAAQLLLERAADLGSGEAAFALASTYDGAPGAPRGASEVRPDANLALRWYARAQELGVEDARKRISELKDGAAAR
jgi:hypothetical protein